MNDTPLIKAVCIFCGLTDKDALFNREHIIPDNIGGTFFMDDAVCSKCNSTLGAHIDAEILKLPDILTAFDALGIQHDRDGILNRQYNITGKTHDVELRFGKANGRAFSFSSQHLPDGSLITPDRDWFAVLRRTVNRDEKLRVSGITEQGIEHMLAGLRQHYEQVQDGEFVECLELGLKLRKLASPSSVTVVPREKANIEPLIAKIAYETIFFYGGAEFFSEENLNLRLQLLTSIKKQEMQKDIFVMRVEPVIKEFSPVHLIRLEFPDYITILTVAFFGCIEYVLVAKPLSRAFVNNLKEALRVDDLYAIDFQQEIDKHTKSLWAVTTNGKGHCIATL
ncbi:MAG: HNH endonuclease [Nitrospirota bacterium]|nr:HNH endonuclease [Nitrospirota bacterium]